MGKASNRKKDRTGLASRHKFGQLTIQHSSALFTRLQANLVHDLFRAIETDDAASCEVLARSMGGEGMCLFEFGFSEPSTCGGQPINPLLLATLARAKDSLEWMLNTLIAEKLGFPMNFVLHLSEWLDSCDPGTPDRALLEMAFGKFAQYAADEMPEAFLKTVPPGMLGFRAREMLADATRRKIALAEQGVLAEFLPAQENCGAAPKDKRL